MTLDIQELLVDVIIESAYNDSERNTCKHWVWLKMCGKHYQIFSSLVPEHLVVEYEFSRIEVVV